MIYLMQVLNMLNIEQVELFESLFSDLSFELDDMGYKDCPEQLISDMLDNHLGIEMLDDDQMKLLTEKMLDERLLKAAINVRRLELVA